MKHGWLRLIFVSVIGIGSSSALAQSSEIQTDLKTYSDALVDAQRSGRSDVFSMLGILLAGLSIGGAGVYLILKKQLSNQILSVVEERQARNMIRMGLRSWDLAIIKTLGPEARLAALQSAIAHTRHAVDQLRTLKIDTVVQGDLRALAATNLGYFLVTLADEIQFLHPGQDVSPFLNEAAAVVDSVSVFVESAVRMRRTEDSKWWEVMESRLYVLFKSTSQPNIAEFKSEIEKITADTMIPLRDRNEIGAIWAPMLSREG